MLRKKDINMAISKKAKIVLFTLLGVTVIFGGILIYGVWSIYSIFSNFGPRSEASIPTPIREPRILKGAELFERKEVFRKEKMGLIEIAQKSRQIPDEKEKQKYVNAQSARMIYNYSDLKVCGDQLLAAGEFGVFIFDTSLSLKQEIFFDSSPEKVKIGGYEMQTNNQRIESPKIFELEKNKQCGFISKASISGVTVLGATGQIIWEYGKETIDLGTLTDSDEERQERYKKDKHIISTAAGDIDGDGVAELAVAQNNDGLHLFDIHGNQKWFYADASPRGKLLIADLNGDGKNELAKIDSNFMVWDTNGKLIQDKNMKSSGYIIVGLNKEGKNQIQSISIRNNKLSLTNEDGNPIFNAEAPLSEVPLEKSRVIKVPTADDITVSSDTASCEAAVWVGLKKGKPKYLAVVASFIGISRSNLYIYETNGNLIYQELLAEDAETIAVMPGVNELESVVVGGKDTIWKYGMKQ